MMSTSAFRPGVLAGALILLVLSLAVSPAVTPARAVAFRPDILAQVRAQGTLPAMVTGIQTAERSGLDRPRATARGWLRHPGEGRAIPDRDAIVILVDFSDNQANQSLYPSGHYSEMLFSVGTYATGSMRDWYLENSYGQFNVTGAVTIWLRMPQTYAYYVDGQAGMGTYPHNTQKLTEDAVAAADPYVDFSQFDNDGPDGIPNSGDDDGIVDALFVVHAGPGRETTGSNDDIHSHAWAVVNPPQVDGVTAYSYSIEPDEGSRGVFCHEFGHVLGLPDLYDTDYSSSGVGDWCCMSFGSWGGGGLTPVHLLSWCKARLDFLDPTTPRVNLASAAIPQVETNPTSFNLWTGGYPERQYFTAENRQRVGADVSLPGTGLIICHIDENQPGNSDETHPLVMVEQADGLNELMHGGGSNPGDPWPGSTNNHAFTDVSNPNTRDYAGQPTQVAVQTISASGANMTADMQVETTPLLVLQNYEATELNGNGDGNVDPGEEFDLLVTLFNRGAPAAGVTGTLSSFESGITISGHQTSFGLVGGEGTAVGTPPFRVSLSPGSQSDGLTFTLAVQGQSGPLASVPLLVGVNDALDAFRWEHAVITPSYGDQWHISTGRNHTPGGRFSWKCGVEGGTYADLLDAGLVTRPLPLATVQAVRFWHWIEAEDDAGQTAWDGGIVEASVDGGPWVQLTPDGGYPYTIIANPASPFTPGTPCYSGSADWSEARFDLTGLTGDQVRLRFRFGSDGAVTREGWYIDDVTVEGELPVAVADAALLTTGLHLAPPSPNPARGQVAIRFIQPVGQPVSLTLVDPTGRRLMEWSYPAATGPRDLERNMQWNGRTRDGSPLRSGVYFLRWRSGGSEQTQRLLWIR
jgi:immune inhibitor A